MIIIIIVNFVNITQYQITDYLNESYHEIIKIKRYIRRNSQQTIQARLKPKRHSKQLAKKNRQQKHFNHQKKLDAWITPIKTSSKLKKESTNQEPQKVKSFKQMELPFKTLHVGKKQSILVPCATNLSQEAKQIKIIQENTFLAVTSDIPNHNSFSIYSEPQEGPYLNTLPFQYFDRFPGIPAVTQEEFCSDPQMKDAWIMYQEVENFTGLFQHLIILNSFSYWEQVETELRGKGFSPKGFSVQEFVKWEFFRHSQGIDHYEAASSLFKQFDRNLLAQVFIHPERIPQPYHASYYYQWLTPAHFHHFFLLLVQECVFYGIIIPKIAMADGLFERSAAGNFSKDKELQPTDPDATRTVHNKKYLGKGFMAIVFCAWCRKRWLPVDVRVFTGSMSENAYFKPIFADFLATTPYEWKAILYDTGASAVGNRQFVKDQQFISGITARSNIKQEVILEFGKDRYGFLADMPDGMSLKQYQRLLEHRSQIEAIFSPFTTVFDMKRMNTMGWGAAMIHICKYLSLLLLHALTAYKVNAEHLLMSAKAFTHLI
jgi:hypothetical protein